MKPLFDPSGGIRQTDAFTLVSIIQHETWRFCETFLNFKNDPKGRLFDQIMKESQGEAFVEKGGFKERLMENRMEARDAQRGILTPSGEPAPACPECGNPMRLRKPRSGGKTFWGCSNFPACRGTREAGGATGVDASRPESTEVGGDETRPKST